MGRKTNRDQFFQKAPLRKKQWRKKQKKEKHKCYYAHKENEEIIGEFKRDQEFKKRFVPVPRLRHHFPMRYFDVEEHRFFTHEEDPPINVVEVLYEYNERLFWDTWEGIYVIPL